MYHFKHFNEVKMETGITIADRELVDYNADCVKKEINNVDLQAFKAEPKQEDPCDCECDSHDVGPFLLQIQKQETETRTVSDNNSESDNDKKFSTLDICQATTLHGATQVASTDILMALKEQYFGLLNCDTFICKIVKGIEHGTNSSRVVVFM